MELNLGRKTFFFLFVPFYWFDQKELFKQIQIILRVFPIYKLITKNKLSEYFWALFWESLFWI